MTREQHKEFLKKLLLVSEVRVGVKWSNEYEASESAERDGNKEERQPEWIHDKTLPDVVLVKCYMFRFLFVSDVYRLNTQIVCKHTVNWVCKDDWPKTRPESNPYLWLITPSCEYSISVCQSVFLFVCSIRELKTRIYRAPLFSAEFPYFPLKGPF